MRELKFDTVTVRYGHGRQALNAVEAVTLAVPAGHVVGLVGESGSGKSTLARAAVGLAPVTTGQILLDGEPLPRRFRAGSRRPLQMVFQDPYSSLNPRMTIGESIAEAIPRFGAASRPAEVTRLLDLVDIDPARASALPAQLSGGQRQRVALARALAGQPDLIIADEVTSALDVSVQGAVLNLIRDLQRRLRLSMLFISHDLAVVRYMSDLIAVMHLGRIVEYGPAEDVLTDPQHPYTRELLASAPHRGAVRLREEDLDPARRAVSDTDPPDPHQPPSGCSFHLRCPVGPAVLTGRDICREIDPTEVAKQRRHHAACHFGAEHPSSASTAT
ncbi:ABC transporter ATP-binding protein [Streptomyces chartreusis]